MSITTKRIRGVDYEYFEYYDTDGKHKSRCLGKKGSLHRSDDWDMVLRILKYKINDLSEKLWLYGEKFKKQQSCDLCGEKRELKPLVHLVFSEFGDESISNPYTVCIDCLYDTFLKKHRKNDVRKRPKDLGFIFLG